MNRSGLNLKTTSRGRQRVEQDRRRRAGGENTRYPLGYLDAAAGRVGHRLRRALCGDRLKSKQGKNRKLYRKGPQSFDCA
jgi:hypothetical protein